MPSHATDPTQPDRATSRPVATGALLSRTIWRWHFWAGLIVGPVLVVASITGGLYVFKEEVQAVLHADLLRGVAPGPRVDLQTLVENASESIGAGWKAESLNIDNQAGGVYSVAFSNERHDYRWLYVDPNSGEVRGELPEEDFFSVVLDIHRRLYAGTAGRVLMELTTCWTAILVLTGLWLWWPKSWRRIGAALTPRLRGKPYVALRDLHAISGVLASPITLSIAVTGLLYSVVWGTTFLLIGYESGAFDIVAEPPQSAVTSGLESDASRITVDEVHAIAVERGMPMARITLDLPQSPSAAYGFKSGNVWGPSIAAILYVDQYSGDVISRHDLGELPAMAQWTQWNYPVHVGSVVGIATKIVWVAVCGVLAAAPITGAAMWLQRRKRGDWGFPKRQHATLPKWIVACVVLLGLVMPLAGASMLCVALLQGVRRCRWSR